MATYDHTAVALCGECGVPIEVDHYGEFWHEGEERPPQPERQPDPPILSFQEQKAEYLRTGVKPPIYDQDLIERRYGPYMGAKKDA